MTSQAETGVAERGGGARLRFNRWALAALAVGGLALILPTLRSIADVSWTTEQGGHGPIVLAIAIWLFARSWPAVRQQAEPGSPWIGGAALGIMLLAYLATRIVGSVTLESLALYGALVATLYLLAGWRGIRADWFPVLYFIFVLPPPGSVVATATQPLRLEISAAAVSILKAFGYPAASSGLTIFIDQYALEVKAACGGLNSMISLSAIGLFYIYVRHRAHLLYMACFLLVIIAMAILANLVRVMLLALITYYLGNDAAQGFLHESAGLVMFVVALSGTMAIDAAVERFIAWRRRRVAA